MRQQTPLKQFLIFNLTLKMTNSYKQCLVPRTVMVHFSHTVTTTPTVMHIWRSMQKALLANIPISYSYTKIVKYMNVVQQLLKNHENRMQFHSKHKDFMQSTWDLVSTWFSRAWGLKFWWVKIWSQSNQPQYFSKYKTLTGK